MKNSQQRDLCALCINLPRMTHLNASAVMFPWYGITTKYTLTKNYLTPESSKIFMQFPFWESQGAFFLPNVLSQLGFAMFGITLHLR